MEPAVEQRKRTRTQRSPSAGDTPQSCVALPASVMIVDDHELFRLGLRLMIDAEPGLKVCAEAATEAAARRLIAHHEPAVLVVDLNLQEGTGLDFIKWATKHHPQSKCIVSTLHDEALYGERCLRAGARGFVNKSAPANNLLKAIAQVLAGGFYCSEELLHKVLERLSTRPQMQTPIERLSDRELAVLRYLGTGFTTLEIATVLHISTSTVDTYRERLKAKLDLASATALIHFATRWVLEEP